MPKPPRNSILVVPARYVQLQRLAEARKQTVTDLLGSLCSAAMAAGEIPDETEGFTIRIDRGQISKLGNAAMFTALNPVVITIDGIEHRTSPAIALQLAASIERLLSGKVVVPLAELLGDMALSASAFTAGERFSVRRKGQGVIVTAGEQSVSLAPSVAMDIARQIRNAIAGAKA